MSVWDEPVVLGVVAGIPAMTAAVLVYRQSKKKDAVTERVGVVSESAQSITQALDGLNLLILAQAAQITRLEAKGVVDEEDMRILKEVNATQQRELNRMYRKYGNGNGGEPL